MDKKIGGKRYIFDLKLVKGYNFVQSVQSIKEGVATYLYTTQQRGELTWTIWKS